MSSSTVLAVADGLKLLELAVEGNGGSFLAGKDYGAVDLLLWPFFERFRPSAVMLPGQAHAAFLGCYFLSFSSGDVCAMSAISHK